MGKQNRTKSTKNMKAENQKYMYTILSKDTRTVDGREMYCAWRFRCKEHGDKETMRFTPMFVTEQEAREFMENSGQKCSHGNEREQIVKIKVYYAE